MLVDMTHANEQRPAATGNAADNVSDAPTGPATSAAARPTTVTLMAQQPQTPRPVQQQNPQPAPLGPGKPTHVEHC